MCTQHPAPEIKSYRHPAIPACALLWSGVTKKINTTLAPNRIDWFLPVFKLCVYKETHTACFLLGPTPLVPCYVIFTHTVVRSCTSFILPDAWNSPGSICQN